MCQYTPDNKRTKNTNQTKMCAIMVFYVYFVLYIELLFGNVDLNGSLNNRLAVPKFVTTDTTTLQNIKDYIFTNMNTGLSFMQVYDEKGKFFGIAANWLIVVFAQDGGSGCMLAIDHWNGQSKLIRAFTDNGVKKLSVINITTTTENNLI